jgi:hypothetical protein
MCTVWQLEITQSSHWRDAFLHGVRGRGCPPPGGHHGLSACQAIRQSHAEPAPHEDIDLVDKRRWQSAIKNARYRQTLKRYH